MPLFIKVAEYDWTTTKKIKNRNTFSGHSSLLFCYSRRKECFIKGITLCKAFILPLFLEERNKGFFFFWQAMIWKKLTLDFRGYNLIIITKLLIKPYVLIFTSINEQIHQFCTIKHVFAKYIASLRPWFK